MDSVGSHEDVSGVIGSNKEKKRNQEFGIGYLDALHKLSKLKKLKSNGRLNQEKKLLPQFAEQVPDRITVAGFQNLIGKMTNSILLKRLQSKETFLHRMVYDNNVDALRALLAVGPKHYREMNDKEGMTPLFVAAVYGKAECIKALLQDSRPQYREIADKDGNTPLNRAVFVGILDCVEHLLKDSRPEYREMRNEYGMTPLYQAASRGNTDCVKALLEGCSPHYREIGDKDGRTPLYMAAYSRRGRCVKALLNGSRPEYREMADADGKTPLYMAAYSGDARSFKALLKDSRPEYRLMRTKEGKTALDFLRTREIIAVVLKDKYKTLVFSFTLKTLCILDEKYIFWSNDSTVKDTLSWIFGDEYVSSKG